MLLHPVTKRADNALEKAFTVAEKGGVKDDKNSPEDRRAAQKGFAVPEHPQHKGYCYQKRENDPGTNNASLAVVCGVEAKQPERKGYQQGQDQDQGQDDQVKGSGRPDLLPTKTLNKEHDCGNGGDARQPCCGNQRKL